VGSGACRRLGPPQPRRNPGPGPGRLPAPPNPLVHDHHRPRRHRLRPRLRPRPAPLAPKRPPATPGTAAWTTPSGRTHQTTAAVYDL